MDKLTQLFDNFKKDRKNKKEQKIINKEKEHYHKQVLKEERAKRFIDKVAPADSYISLKNINKIYDNHVQAVFDFNLDIKKHEFIVFVGPSGCGKSTTLRMIAGLEEITSGDLFIDGCYANELAPKDRDIGMVFQSYALYPHMTVYENMAFGLKVNHVNKEEIEKRVLEAAKILQITEYLNRKPNALSGGQCQRVALGRAIVRNSKVFLMDEPLSNLDAKLRVQMRSEIVKLHKELNATTIYVTHDQTEAMTMASRIVVMNKGYIQQIGTPSEIYNNPSNVFVATFIGSPAMNILKSNYSDGIVTFGDYKLKFGKEFGSKVKEFYLAETSKVKEQIEGWKEEFFNREISSKSFKKLPSTKEKSLEEVKLFAINFINEKLNDENFALIKDKLNGYKTNIENANSPELIEENFNLFVKEFAFENNRLQNPEIRDLVNKFDKLKEQSELENHELLLGIRPEDIHDVTEIPNESKFEEFEFKVSVAELLGHEYYVHVNINEEEIIAKVAAKKFINSDDSIKMFFDKEKIHFFDPITGNKII